MSGFQRMIAIPQEEYIHLKSMQGMNQPEAQKMADLSQQYQQQAQIKDPYEKLILQGSTLEEMKDWKVKFRDALSLGLPKLYRNRGLSLFRSIEPHIKFNERGEIYNTSEQLIPDSRLEDLVQHAVRDRRRNLTPKGWDEFRHLLKSHNVPKFMLNRDTLEELNNEEAIKREVSSTPTSPKRKVMKSSRVPRLKEESVMQRPKRQRKDNPKYGKEFGFLQGY